MCAPETTKNLFGNKKCLRPQKIFLATKKCLGPAKIFLATKEIFSLPNGQK
jgi:hypothetical protein